MFLKSLFGDDMILYTENSKDTTRKLLDLLNKYSKVIGHTKINTQKSDAFLHTNNQKLVTNQKKDKEIFTIATKE